MLLANVQSHWVKVPVLCHLSLEVVIQLILRYDPESSYFLQSWTHSFELYCQVLLVKVPSCPRFTWVCFFFI